MGNCTLDMLLNQEIYSFEIYSEELKSNFPVLHVNAYDDDELIVNKEVNLIIYKKQKGSNFKNPIAIFVSNGVLGKYYGLLRSLNSAFGGLFIMETSLREIEEIRNFFKIKIIEKYFNRRLKIDFISLTSPPLAIIEQSKNLFQYNFSYYSYAGNNSILFVDLKDEFFRKLKLTVRNEISYGLDYLNRNLLLDERSDQLINHYVQLEEIKARRIGIAPLSRDYFEKRVSSSLYKCLVCIDLESLNPVSGIIFSLLGNIADFEYNSSSDIGRRTFVNRALLYHSMQISRDIGAKYFILGTGYIEGGNMASVTKFKKSMASEEVACSIFHIPVSLKGRLYIALRVLISSVFYT